LAHCRSLVAALRRATAALARDQLTRRTTVGRVRIVVLLQPKQSVGHLTQSGVVSRCPFVQLQPSLHVLRDCGRVLLADLHVLRKCGRVLLAAARVRLDIFRVLLHDLSVTDDLAAKTLSRHDGE
jgi:hypothetical protein